MPPLALALCLAVLAGPPPLPAQRARVAAGVAALVPDTVLVGERVLLGLSVRASSEPVFPQVLALTDDLEQLGPPRMGRTGDGAWRAVYRLAAWRTGSLDLPPVQVELPGGGPALRIEPPSLVVTSVLPEAGEPVALRPPRAPALRLGVSWGLVLAALLLAVLLAWLLRRLRRRGTVPGEVSAHVPPDPVEEARVAVAELRAAVAAGAIGAADFYDGIEAVLRRYLARTRGRPTARPVRGLPEDPTLDAATAPADPLFAPMGMRALPARFGALSVGGDELAGDADAVLAWLSAEKAA
jgi:HAMP domain-containing protein